MFRPDTEDITHLLRCSTAFDLVNMIVTLRNALENMTAHAAMYTGNGCTDAEGALVESWDADNVQLDTMVCKARNALARVDRAFRT